MEKVRIAIVGLGDMGTGHVKGFDELEQARLVSICDPNENAVHRAMGTIRNNTPNVYGDYIEMLEKERIDGVVIAVPGYLHEKVLNDCIKHGKHVLLEKPVSIDYDGYKRIRNLNRDNKCIVQIGLVYRYAHLYRTMHERICEKNELGSVLMAWCKEFRQCFPQEDWFYDETKSGGAIVEKNCHHFDLFNWMIGSRPKRVFAAGGQHVYRDQQGCLIDCSYSISKPKIIYDISIVDHAFVIIEYENGAKANLSLCLYLKPENISGDGLEIGFIGSSGKQLIARRDEMFGIYGGEYYDKNEYYTDPDSDGRKFGHIGCQTQRREFMHCIVTGSKPAASIEDTEDSLLIALAAEKSIKEKRIVDIDEFE